MQFPRSKKIGKDDGSEHHPNSSPGISIFGKLPTSLGARKWGQGVPVTPVVNDDDSASKL